MFGIGVPELIIIAVMVSLVLVPFWVIFSKAGFPGALSILMVIPGLNLLVLNFFAFAKWPALRDRQRTISPGGLPQ